MPARVLRRSRRGRAQTQDRCRRHGACNWNQRDHGGYELVKVDTDARGNIDLDDLRAKVDEETAGLMLNELSTLGLFDEHIEEIAQIFHEIGGPLLRRREPECRLRDLEARRHGLRHRPHQPAQDVFAAAWWRWTGRRPDRRSQTAEPYLLVLPSSATASASGWTTTGRSRSARSAPSPVRSGLRPLVRLHPRLGPRAPDDVRGRVLNANYLLARLKDS